MTEAHYERLEERTTEPDNQTPSEAKPQSNFVHIPPQILQQSTLFPKNVEKVIKVLKIFALVKLGLAIVITILGTTCFGMLYFDRAGGSCIDGSGIIVGAFAVMSASIGIASARNPKSRCLLITYFVLCICISILSLELSSLSSFHANYTHRELKNQNYQNENRVKAGLGIHVTLALLGGIHFVCAIITSSLICTIWSRKGCCNAAEQNQTPPVIYIQDQSLINGVSRPHKAIITQQGKTQNVPTFVLQPPLLNDI